MSESRAKSRYMQVYPVAMLLMVCQPRRPQVSLHLTIRRSVLPERETFRECLYKLASVSFIFFVLQQQSPAAVSTILSQSFLASTRVFRYFTSLLHHRPTQVTMAMICLSARCCCSCCQRRCCTSWRGRTICGKERLESILSCCLCS